MAGDERPQIKTRRDGLKRLLREYHRRHDAQKEIGEHTESVIAPHTGVPPRHMLVLKMYPKATTRHRRQGIKFI